MLEGHDLRLGLRLWWNLLTDAGECVRERVYRVRELLHLRAERVVLIDDEVLRLSRRTPRRASSPFRLGLRAEAETPSSWAALLKLR